MIRVTIFWFPQCLGAPGFMENPKQTSLSLRSFKPSGRPCCLGSREAEVWQMVRSGPMVCSFMISGETSVRVARRGWRNKHFTWSASSQGAQMELLQRGDAQTRAASTSRGQFPLVGGEDTHPSEWCQWWGCRSWENTSLPHCSHKPVGRPGAPWECDPKHQIWAWIPSKAFSTNKVEFEIFS